MAEIIGFPSPATPEVAEPCDPHLEGPARCLRCKHTWTAVTPAGIVEGLECSACGCDTGVINTLVWPSAVYWRCNCGGHLFALTPTGAPLCAHCGLRATSWAEG